MTSESSFPLALPSQKGNLDREQKCSSLLDSGKVMTSRSSLAIAERPSHPFLSYSRNFESKHDWLLGLPVHVVGRPHMHLRGRSLWNVVLSHDVPNGLIPVDSFASTQLTALSDRLFQKS
jgi:hypothetical protein